MASYPGLPEVLMFMGLAVMASYAHGRNGAACPAEATGVLVGRRARPLVLAAAK